MFKKNDRHYPLPLTSKVGALPKKLRKHLDISWSGVFYREVFFRSGGAPFTVLYADCPSRPNIHNLKSKTGLVHLCSYTWGAFKPFSGANDHWDPPFADPLGGNRVDFLSAKDG